MKHIRLVFGGFEDSTEHKALVLSILNTTTTKYQASVIDIDLNGLDSMKALTIELKSKQAAWNIINVISNYNKAAKQDISILITTSNTPTKLATSIKVGIPPKDMLNDW